MFTGIIEEVGRVASVASSGGGARIEVAAERVLDGTREGDSISTDGVCLTATRLTRTGFVADCSAETLRLTTIGHLRAGDPVNLERALALGARLGGHLVQGHVEGTGQMLGRRAVGESVMMRFSYPPELGRYIVHKGSIAVSGICSRSVRVRVDLMTQSDQEDERKSRWATAAEVGRTPERSRENRA